MTVSASPETWVARDRAPRRLGIRTNASRARRSSSLGTQACLAVAETVHAHPTLAEVFLEAVEAAQGHPIHINK